MKPRPAGLQIELELDPPELDAAALERRLRARGLPASIPVIGHANRRVLVSITGIGGLRVHLGFAAAPDPILDAVVRWSLPRTRRADRLAAQRILLAFPVHLHVPPARPPRRRTPEPAGPGDGAALGRLVLVHAELNDRHFGGVLGAVSLVLSGRMRRRLGEFRPGTGPETPTEIAISRRHLRRDGWDAAVETLLHEMVHQWQHETGRRLGHGAEFRRKCTAIGIEPSAIRSYLRARP